MWGDSLLSPWCTWAKSHLVQPVTQHTPLTHLLYAKFICGPPLHCNSESSGDCMETTLISVLLFEGSVSSLLKITLTQRPCLLSVNDGLTFEDKGTILFTFLNWSKFLDTEIWVTGVKRGNITAYTTVSYIVYDTILVIYSQILHFLTGPV